MALLGLFFATNRNHLGDKKWRPSGYGMKFSDSGIENLRFGKLTLEASDAQIGKFLRSRADGDSGDGEKLSAYLKKKVGKADIRAYPEELDSSMTDTSQDPKHIRLGSLAMFSELQAAMKTSRDVLIYIHGFNVSWDDAVAAALALQTMLNRRRNEGPAQPVLVVLFSWPSDGMALPYVSYKSDRTEAEGSGYAIGRGFLKVRDFLVKLADRPNGLPDPSKLCGQDIHLLCHSMGNYVLQNALARIREMHNGRGLPRLFEHIFMCAADVDDRVLEPDHPMADLHGLSRGISVYHNRGDVAMYVSDYTKGNPDRLGHNGAARPSMLHNKVHQIDCSPIVGGLVEHSYYLWGPVNTDICLTVGGEAQDSPLRTRRRTGPLDNVWAMQQRSGG